MKKTNIDFDGLLNGASYGYYVIAQRQHITGKWIMVTNVSFDENDKDKAFEKIKRRYNLWKHNDGNEHENIKLYEINSHDGKYEVKEIVEIGETA